MNPLPRRSKLRLTRDVMIYDERIKALRRIEAQRHRPYLPPPTEQEIAQSRNRWATLRRLI